MNGTALWIGTDDRRLAQVAQRLYGFVGRIVVYQPLGVFLASPVNMLWKPLEFTNAIK